MINTEDNFIAYIDDTGKIQFQPIYNRNKDILLKSLTTANKPYLYFAQDHKLAEEEALKYFTKDSVNQAE